MSWTPKELEAWDKRAFGKAQEFGLNCYPQEFEICNHNEMLGYMAYSGMPSHYPHWSYGKAYEKLKTLYDYGVSGLPYEMVINSNPALAYLMRDNSLLLQILTMAHVYGHNDFFKNNFTFKTTKAEHTISRFKAHADIIRGYIEDPSIGLEKVEPFLDAAHALSLQCQRNLSIKKKTSEQQLADLREKYYPKADTDHPLLEKRKEPDEKGFLEASQKNPREPEEDILMFIANNNPHLQKWQRDTLLIVHAAAQYFIPQIETKIMNEGWASYWHKRILDSLDLPQNLHIEFIVKHNQVIRPFPGGLNPYYLGIKVWEDIRRRYDEPTPEEAKELGPAHLTGTQKLFEVRETDRDVSFLRRFLTENLMRELHMYDYEAKGEDIVVSSVSDEDGWEKVKATLIAGVGMNTIPVIKVHDADLGGARTLLVVHEHDGRDLFLEFAEKTLGYLYMLWGRDVALETVMDAKKVLLRYDAKGFKTTKINK